MRSVKFYSFAICTCSIYVSLVLSSVRAQIIPDDSLGDENSVVSPDATIEETQADLIEGGATRDNNLFHSFSDFNVDDGSAVYFASPAGIENILTRVTGNDVSNIFGKLGVYGAANLFLLNPNGIVFGENATLDVNGSFLATTANSYIFENNFEYSASESGAVPEALLKIDLTPGLQMGANPGNITVEGNSHELIDGVLFPLQNNSLSKGLQISAQQTLSLVGGEIELDGGVIKTAGGNIELASVKQGNINLDFKNSGDRLNTSGVTEFGNIKLSNRALLDASGVSTGNITLQGYKIDLENASAAIIQNFGSQNSGNITVEAADSINLSGTVRNSPDITTPQGIIAGVTSSRFTTETLGTGKGGDIQITSNNLSVDEGGSISARSFSNADTGNVNLEISKSIDIGSPSILNPGIPSVVGTVLFNDGNSGNINITAGNINIFNGGTLAALNFGSGKGGDINLSVAHELKLSGFNPISGSPSNLSSTTYRTGDSQNVAIDASRILLLDGAKISTATLAEGDAGELTINATEFVLISGTTLNRSFESSIASDAEILPLALQQLLGLANIPSGNSGNITLNTPNLIMSDGSEVAVNNKGLGDSGSLYIQSDRISLDADASITAFSASGQGGNIDLQVRDWLSLDDRSTITAQTTANRASDRLGINGGNINIDTDIVTLLDNSEINASATEGNGGNINITTKGLFVSADSLVSASSEFGLDGNVEVENLNSDRPIELVKLAQNLVNATEQITAGCNSNSDFAISGKGGLPTNPTKNLRGQAIWQDSRIPLLAEAIDSASQSQIKTKTIVEAQTWQVNPAGKIELIAIADSHSHFNNYRCQSN